MDSLEQPKQGSSVPFEKFLCHQEVQRNCSIFDTAMSIIPTQCPVLDLKENIHMKCWNICSATYSFTLNQLIFMGLGSGWLR
jgi:hypothetical protein